jgi:hypothetical protein
VKVVLFAPRPTPPELSATVPLKVVGTVAPRKKPPFAGAVTDAVTGAVESFVTVADALPVLLTASLTHTTSALLPSASEALLMLVGSTLGAL